MVFSSQGWLVCYCDGLCAAVDAKFAVDLLVIPLYRVPTQEQFLGDLLV